MSVTNIKTPESFKNQIYDFIEIWLYYKMVLLYSRCFMDYLWFYCITNAFGYDVGEDSLMSVILKQESVSRIRNTVLLQNGFIV